MKLGYQIIDAFADRPFTGNPAAVVPLDGFLPDALMQAIAAENNLSETAFVVPEGSGETGTDWALRWFTPAAEVELCGHATLATAFVLAGMGAPPPWRFATASGVLTVTREGERFVMDFPLWRTGPATPPAWLAGALGATPAEIHHARDWICVFSSPEEVIALQPDHGRLAALPGERVIATAAGGTAPDGSPVDITSRYFAASIGVPEDPVTGAAHTQLVPFWAERLGRRELVCRQASRRGGTLFCRLDGDRVKIAGTAVAYAAGEISLPG